MPSPDQASSTDPCEEAARILTICNACRYCEGHCAVFPAMERRLSFSPADIDYLANLCHNCGSCYHHCQYAPPHEFGVNVPSALAESRTHTHRKCAWPRLPRVADSRSGSLALFALTVVAFIWASASIVGSTAFFSSQERGFYALIPHHTMIALFGAASLFVLCAIAIPLVRYWRVIGLPSPSRTGIGNIVAGIGAALTLKNLTGGAGEGCTWPLEQPSQARRLYHHCVFYGFISCFAATITGTVYHYGLAWHAPYPVTSLPKLLGTFGGIAITIGTAGLFGLGRLDTLPQRPTGNSVFLILLFVTSVTGLALMLARETTWLGLLLGLHLGSVLALFLSMPYGKFMHGLYRLIALIGSEYEKSAGPIAGRGG